MSQNIPTETKSVSIDQENLLRIHKDLVRINSIGKGLEGCEQAERPMMKYLYRFFTELGLDVELQEVEVGQANVIGKLIGSGSKTLILESHMDVVSSKGMTIEPFNPLEKDGRIYGRGACDTKGSMACMLETISSFVRSDQIPPATIVFVGMVGEEVGFDGAKKFVELNEVPADGAIIGEPTLCQTITAHKGGMRYDVMTKGQSAHGSKPELGKSAIYDIVKVIELFQNELIPRFEKQTHPLCGHSTINIGTIKGGVQVNFVPDECVIRIDQRLIPGEDKNLTLAILIEALENLQKNYSDLKVDLRNVFQFDAMETDPASELAQCCFQACGQTEPLGVPYGTDGSFIQQLNIPCVILGPGSIEQAHHSEEYIEIEQLNRCAEIYRQIIQTFGN